MTATRANEACARRRHRLRAPDAGSGRRAAAAAGGDGCTMGRLLRAARGPPLSRPPLLLLLLAGGECASLGRRGGGPVGRQARATVPAGQLL